MKSIRPFKTYSLPVRRDLTDKKICIEEAKAILRQKHIEHMSERQIAEELYFHAGLYYICRFLERFHIPLAFLRRHADPIDLSDRGDTPFRKFCFRVYWFVPGRNLRSR